MDMRKFCDKLLDDDNIKDIPLSIVFRVVFSIFAIIDSGECFYPGEYD